MRKRKIWLDILMSCVLLFGIGAICYPFVGDVLMNHYDQQLVEKSQKKISHANEKKIRTELAKKKAANLKLAKEKLLPGNDPFSSSTKEEAEKKRQPGYYESHTLGVLTIPAIDVRLPIFDRTTEEFLNRGATLLEGSSYPVGGKSTHSVISAHRGLRNAKFFTDLPELKKKDVFYIEILGDKLAYQVEKIEVVEPDQIESLQIQENRDLVTLLTCTPYMVNSHRLLVTGFRIPYREKQASKAINKVKKGQNWRFYLILSGALLLFLLVFRMLYKRFKKRRQ